MSFARFQGLVALREQKSSTCVCVNFYARFLSEWCPDLRGYTMTGGWPADHSFLTVSVDGSSVSGSVWPDMRRLEVEGALAVSVVSYAYLNDVALLEKTSFKVRDGAEQTTCCGKWPVIDKAITFFWFDNAVISDAVLWRCQLLSCVGSVS